MIRDLEARFRATSERVVPWFMAAMPPAYFQDTDHATRLSHVAAIVAARASGLPPRLILEQDGGNTWTFIHESDHLGLLAELLAQLPRDRALVSAKVHTAADGNLVLDVFRFGEPPVNTAIESADRINKLQQMQTYLDALGEETRAEMVMAHLAASSDEYVRTVSPLRIHETWKLSRRVLGTDETAAAFSEQGDSDFQRISVATRNANPRSLFEPETSVQLGAKGFIDVLLDLITPDPAVRARVVDLFGIPELLYLGPDENISPAMIEWVVDRAARHGHPAPNTFMSSKPGAGSITRNMESPAKA